MRITCYMNMPTPQQEGFYRSLSRLCDLTVVYDGDVSAERRQLGWSLRPDGYVYHFQNSLSIYHSFVPDSADFHFVAGLPGNIRNVSRVLFSSRRSRIGVQAEMRIPEVETKRRRLQSIVYSKILNLRDGTFFGIGQQMRDYYLELGVPSHRIFPFAYFSSDVANVGAMYAGDIIFVGQLVHRKGVDVLLEAFACTNARRERKLTIVGDGRQRERLESLVRDLDLQKDVHFVGVIEQHGITSLMNQASVLVLPSRHDGWGYVVNEALRVGLPVVVSDCCGVAEVIQTSGGGFVVESGNRHQLAHALDQLLASEAVWRHHSEAALAAHTRISAEAGARYFVQIVRHILSGYDTERPAAPWLTRMKVYEK